MDAISQNREDTAPTVPALRLKERLTYEFGPLVAFFIGNQVGGIFVGTGIFMGATVLALLANFLRERRLPVTPLASTLVVLAFGGASLLAEEAWIIMVRPSVMNGFYALVLLGGLIAGRLVLRAVMHRSLVLSSDRAWRVLTRRAIAYLTLLVILNEITWRYFPVDVWVAFKTFAVLPMNLAFIAAQVPFVRRHRAASPAPGDDPAPR
ncbi:inner membrane-spanning protein YciB [Salinarimonas ramus]|uniref:Inner membrane-spanning protein YciB n=1 Tax=Salinarimonas ramus TaxID=690164 RepID=A0A917QDI9_9HYPH|nr:inner membrane-spanning protein YciB [Salinarimonas ramus]GGK43411.1 putative intracellular septation protein A [Salinarimonas ramus]